MKGLDKILKYIVPERIPGFTAYLYDKIARTAIPDYYRKIAEEITSKLDSGRILDIGTGPAYLPIEMVKRRKDIRVDGIDLTKKMVKIARRNVSEAGFIHQINCMVANGNNLKGFETYSYDMVISTGALHSWKNPSRVINECYRVLKPGGELWIYDPADIGSKEKIRLLKGFNKMIYKFLSLIPREIIPITYTANEVREIIHKTKFKDYEVKKKENSIEIRLKKQV